MTYVYLIKCMLTINSKNILKILPNNFFHNIINILNTSKTHTHIIKPKNITFKRIEITL